MKVAKNVRRSKKPVAAPNSFGGAAGQLLVAMFGSAAEQIGEDLTQLYKNWSWRKTNLVKIAALHAQEINRRHLSSTELTTPSEGDAYRIMEAASLEDDESVQRLWAGLIVTAMDPSASRKPSKAHMSILQSIGPAEVALLLLIQKIDEAFQKTPLFTFSIAKSAKRDRVEISEIARKTWWCIDKDTRESAVENLLRLRCIAHRLDSYRTRFTSIPDIPLGISHQSTSPKIEAVAIAFEEIEHALLTATGTRSMKPLTVSEHNPIPEVIFMLTSLGRSLMKACAPIQSTNNSH